MATLKTLVLTLIGADRAGLIELVAAPGHRFNFGTDVSQWTRWADGPPR